ncbi:MAG: alpha-ketoglutarate-dependent dioxygenase AlkB [Acidobacteria bacterium]|nr:alpha-ketoglutarate-dependent dioxygenase AlkB [Acidobacteriota bacterium]
MLMNILRNRHVPRERIEAARRLPRGLHLLPDFVPGAQQSKLAAWIAGHVSWSCSGYCGNRRETYTPGHQPIPEWGEALGRKMHEAGFFAAVPNHLHLIEYNAGSGFPFHRDCDEIGAVIAGLTLGSSRVIEFRRDEGPATVRVLLQPGDLYVMSGEVRRDWQHGIPFTEADEFGGKVYPRSKTISVTWRLLA